MAQNSFPFTENLGGDQGPYSSQFFAGMMSGLFGQDVSGNNSSVILNTGSGTDPLLVTQTTPATNAVLVSIGKAIVKGYYYFNDASLTLNVAANTDGSGYNRIDTVILRIDYIGQTVRAIIKQGTPALSPVAPTLTKNATFYEVPLANITVANLFTTITNANIDNSVRVQGFIWDEKQGGTGESTYSKGDLLVGNSSSGVSKLTVGSDGQSFYSLASATLGSTWITGLYPIVQPTLITAPTSGITILSIPSTFDSLILHFTLESDRASLSDDVGIYFNGAPGGTAYGQQFSYINQATNTVSQTIGATFISHQQGATGSTATADFVVSTSVWIPHYANTNWIKYTQAEWSGRYNTTLGVNNIRKYTQTGYWTGTAAINSITIVPVNGTNFIAGSEYALYGVGRKAV